MCPKVLLEKQVGRGLPKNLRDTSCDCDLLLGLPLGETTHPRLGEINQGFGIRWELLIRSLFTTTYFFLLSQKLKGLKEENQDRSFPN